MQTPTPPRARRPAAAGSFPNAWRLFHTRGVPVGLHPSALLTLGIVAATFLGRYAPTLSGSGTLALWTCVLATVVLASQTDILNQKISELEAQSAGSYSA